MVTELSSIIENIKIAAELSQDGICITNNLGTIVYANDTLASELGYSPVEIIGNPRDVLITVHKALDDEVSEISRQFDEHEIIKLSSPRSELVFAYRAEKNLLDSENNIIGKLESLRFHQPPTINKNILNILFKIGQLPLGTKNLDELFEEIQLLISSVLYAKNLYIYLKDKNKELDLVYFKDIGKREVSRLTEIHDLAHYCIKSEKPILLNSAEILNLVNEKVIKIDTQVPVYAMCVPLKIKNTIIGVIATQIFNTSYTYSKTDLQVLSYASNQIAISIEEARINRTLNDTLDDIINIIEAIPYGIVLVSDDNKIELINDTALNLLDVALNTSLEKINKELFSVSPDGFCILEPTKNEKAIEIQKRSKDGKNQDLLKSTKQITFNKKNVFLETFVDITELKVAQELINRLSQTVYQSTNSIIITDKEGVIEFVNSSFSEITKFQSNEILGKHINVTQSKLNEETLFKEQWAVINSGNQWEDKVYSQTKLGDVYFEKTRVSPIMNNDGEITHFLFVSEDITEQIKAEEELKEYVEEIQYNKDILEENSREFAIVNAKLAESEELLQEENANKDKFFSIISHDLKSPLSGLLGLSGMLVEDYDDFTDDEKYEYVVMLNKSATKMHELLESLLHWARAQSGKLECVFENIDLYKMVDNLKLIYTEVANKKNIHLQNRVSEDLIVYADKDVISTIIRNLIANAIKFTNPGGEIEIITEYNEETATISISDSGIGMSEQDQNKLFKIEIHHTTKGTNKEEGTGLGLILCKELAGKLNGKIWVSSKLDKGSTFSFTVPIAK